MRHHRADEFDIALGLGSPRTRRFALLGYPATMFVLNFVWEWAHLPLYTLAESPWRTIIYSIVHCTVGDVLIGLSTLLLAMGTIAFVTRRSYAPFWQIVSVALPMGIAYTVFSEWLNVEVRGAWAYADHMPRLPLLGTGLSPVLQWTVVPPIAARLAWAWVHRPCGPSAK